MSSRKDTSCQGCEAVLSNGPTARDCERYNRRLCGSCEQDRAAATLTADTITDSQIRELRMQERRADRWINVDICNTALGELRGARGQVVDFAQGEIRDARQRCADVINAGRKDRA